MNYRGNTSDSLGAIISERTLQALSIPRRFADYAKKRAAAKKAREEAELRHGWAGSFNAVAILCKLVLHLAVFLSELFLVICVLFIVMLSRTGH